jgi:hypothetical protein
VELQIEDPRCGEAAGCVAALAAWGVASLGLTMLREKRRGGPTAKLPRCFPAVLLQ